MTPKEIFKIWAPYNKRWTNWVRPVPFINLDTPYQINEIIDYTIPNINYISELKKDTAIIIDTSGVNSIKEGIALAKLGYRPIPLFNGTNEPKDTLATTNNHIIEPLLIWGANELTKISLPDDAPPVFLLDRNRLNRYKMNRGVFDNSWDIYSQDIPTPEYFIKNGITTIIVKGEKFNKDLNIVLYKFKKNNIKVLYTNGYTEFIEPKIKKPKTVDI